MKRLLLSGLISSLLVFFSACTLIQNLMVVNSSDENIEIQYETKDRTFLPEITSESNLNNWRFFQKDWDKMPIEQYSFSEHKKSVTVKIKPHEVVKVGWGDPYYFDKGDYNYFALKTLKIKGNNKEVYFENSSKLLNEFRENDYQIIYR